MRTTAEHLAHLDNLHTAALNLRDAMDRLNLDGSLAEAAADQLADALDAFRTFAGAVTR